MTDEYDPLRGIHVDEIREDRTCGICGRNTEHIGTCPDGHWICWSCDEWNQAPVGTCVHCGVPHVVCPHCGEHEVEDELCCTWCEGVIVGNIIGPICETRNGSRWKWPKCNHRSCLQISNVRLALHWKGESQ